MAIPKNITREHILEAIRQIDAGVDHPFGSSVTYDVLHEGKYYPPKVVIGLASQLATGKTFGPGDFYGGEGSSSTNPVLRNLGFTVVDKEGQEVLGPDPKITLAVAHPDPAVRDVMRVLTRLPIPRGQLCLYKLLWDSYPEPVPAAEINSRAFGYEGGFRGMMAALAVRANNTKLETATPIPAGTITSASASVSQCRNGEPSYRLKRSRTKLPS